MSEKKTARKAAQSDFLEDSNLADKPIKKTKKKVDAVDFEEKSLLSHPAPANPEKVVRKAAEKKKESAEKAKKYDKAKDSIYSSEKSERKSKPSSDKRKSFDKPFEKSSKPGYSQDRSERPARSFSDRPNEGEQRPARSFERPSENRGERSERSERPARSFNDRPSENRGERNDRNDRGDRGGDRARFDQPRESRGGYQGGNSRGRSGSRPKGFANDRAKAEMYDPNDTSKSASPFNTGSKFEKTKVFEKAIKSANKSFHAAPIEELSPITRADLPESLITACEKAGWPELMPVQAKALPYLLAGQDFMIQSQTGSGKTGTYLLPLINKLDPKIKAVQALVLVPTRELASQVEREAMTLFAGTGLKVAAVYGGVAYGKQLDALRGGASLVVGTPGRVLDHLLKETMSLDKLTNLIFDEADRMLSIGFYPDMKEIQKYLPILEEDEAPIHSCLFSATYPPHVLKLAGEFLHNAQMLSLSEEHVHAAEIKHYFCECKSMNKDTALIRLIETENPVSAIIFSNTKANVHYISTVLQNYGFSSEELSSDLSQARREIVLAKLRRGDIRFLVATDVAARGIDIPDLSHVFLFEPPDDRESYIHRSGRTGRAGASGTVISFVDVMEKIELSRISHFYKIEINPIKVPSEEDVSHAISSRLIATLENRLRKCNNQELTRIARYTDLAKELANPSNPDSEGNEVLLLSMLLDDFYKKSLSPMPTGNSYRSERPRSDNYDRERPRGDRNSRFEKRPFRPR